MNLTVLGAGKMGEALTRGIVKAGFVQPEQLVITDIVPELAKSLAAALGATAMTDNKAAVQQADIVIIAVKPKDIAAPCRDIAAALPPGGAVVSIAAGITLRQLAAFIGRDDIALARVMPNTPCLVGAGAIGLSFSTGVSAELRDTIARMLATTGIVEELPESLLDAVTGLSGSGPAYIAILIEALADGGVLMGLPRATAQRLAAQTVYGMAKMQIETGQHPAQIKDAVSSPGGTTITALSVLEERGFRSALMAAVEAATLRSKALSGD